MANAAPNAQVEALPDRISLAAATRVWAKIGWLGFGGPAGQIALMHRELVERRRWISEARFLHALSYCMLLPGPEAQQLAIYIGWLLHRTAGGVIAGTLFVLPGAFAILVLSMVYAAFGQLPLLAALFFGLKAAVLAVVIEAVLRIGRRALKNRVLVIVAIAAFIFIYTFHFPFPLIVLGAALFGVLGRWLLPLAFPDPVVAAAAADTNSLVDRALARGELTHVRASKLRAAVVLVVLPVLWMAPVAATIALFGRDSLLAQQGLFFSQAALVTFGGAYAVLAYVAQRAVESFAWLSAGQMLDGLALAETTPGPLILVVQFVAFLGAYQHSTVLTPIWAGVVASLLTTWVTFLPCFLWIFLGAPYIEALRGQRTLHAALSAITAAVVGVIVNLSVWFTLRTVFHRVEAFAWGPLRVDVPAWDSFEPAAFLLAAAALVAMLRCKLGMGWTLLGCALIGTGRGLLG